MKKKDISYPILKTKSLKNIVEIQKKFDQWSSWHHVAYFTKEPTANCSLCSLAGVDNLLEDKALEFALQNAPKDMILMDINDHNRSDVLAICKKMKYRVLLNKKYKSVTGSDMVILIVTVVPIL